MAVDWQRFVMVPGARARQHVMVLGPGSKYNYARPPDIVIEQRNGVFIQVAPATSIPVRWDTDERGYWVPVKRGHTETRAIAERHATGERGEPGVGTHESVFGGMRAAGRRAAVAEESSTPRRSEGIFRRQKERRRARGNVFFPGG